MSGEAKANGLDLATYVFLMVGSPYWSYRSGLVSPLLTLVL